MWQAIVDGRADNINALYPNASIDHYPSEAKSLENNPQALSDAAARYAPARALGNRRAGPRQQPVEDMIAASRKIAAGEANTRVRRGGIKELDTLAVAFNDMADRLARPHRPLDTSLDELHDFAAALSIPRRSFQGDHYDIPEEYYDAAVAAGATPVSSKELVRRLNAAGLRRRKRPQG